MVMGTSLIDAQFSYLFVPGQRPDRFGKALAAGADAVVVDLEDAVPPEAKDSARRFVEAWLANGASAWVRINGFGTQWFYEDLAALKRAPPVGIMVPKVNSRAELDEVWQYTRPDLPVIPLIETAVGLMASFEIARAPGVVRLAFGAIDFQLDIDVDTDGASLLLARSQLVVHSRAAGISAPLDGITVDTKAHENVLQAALQARALGFGGKMCIHPSQVSAIRQAFSPTPEQLEWARGIIHAAELSGGAATTFQGKMIDRPIIDRAERMLRRRTTL